MLKPKLRGIEIVPTKVDDQVVAVLRDPLRYVDSSLVISRGAALLVLLMNGQRTLSEIQDEWLSATGDPLLQAQLEDLVAKLDKALFLDNESFAEAREQKQAAFHAAPVREPTHAGSGYAAEATDLRRQLSGFYEEAELSETPTDRPTGRLAGLIAPHIDFRRGGIGYAKACQALAQHSDADRYLILGVSHQPMKLPFALTHKDFATPLGAVQTDRVFVDALAARSGSTDFFADEWNHHAEHSIEFQAVALAATVPDLSKIRIVPVLCHPPAETLEPRGPSPLADERIASFLDALHTTIEEAEGKTVIIASVDLSHVGVQFGDKAVSRERLQGLARDDAALIDSIQAGDSEGFMQLLRQNGNANNVCGVAPIYAFLRLLGGELESQRLDYRQWTDGSSSVTFTVLSFLRTTRNA